MEGWSPFTCRAAAIGLLLGVSWLLLAGLLLPLALAIGRATDELADARFELARLRQMDGRPGPPKADVVPAGLVVGTPASDGARQVMESAIRAAAGTASVTIDHLEIMPPADAGSGQFRMSLAVSGREAEVREFIGAVEAGRPMIRFRPWRLTPDGEIVRFEATAVTPWGKP